VEGVLYGHGVDVGVVAGVERDDGVVVNGNVVAGWVYAVPDRNGDAGAQPKDEGYGAAPGCKEHSDDATTLRALIMARVNHRFPILSITYLHGSDFVYIVMECKRPPVFLLVRCGVYDVTVFAM
jgi:hypothetical protein